MTDRHYVDLSLSPESLKSVAEYRTQVAMLEDLMKRLNAQVMQDDQGLTKLAARLKKFANDIPKITSQVERLANSLGKLSAAGVTATDRTNAQFLRGQLSAFRDQNFNEGTVSRKLQGDQVREQREILRLMRQQNEFAGVTKTRAMELLKVSKDRSQVEKIQLEMARQLGVQQRLILSTDERISGVARARAAKLEEVIRFGDIRLAQIKEELRAAKQQEQVERKRADYYRNIRDGARTSRIASTERVLGDGGASLFRIQASLLGNFILLGGIISGIQNALSFSLELDKSLRNLQAITTTSEAGMVRLKDSIIDVSEATKFTALEVAEAAVTLGQAGLSVQQIEASLKSITLLAAATGTDLAKAVDVVSSTLTVFNMSAEQTGHVADVMTAAINNSKLNLEKLTLGLQYAGNIAAETGVSFEELTASLGAMANAGIRSGSTLGTGTRALIVSLQKPSEEFQTILRRLGLTLEDVNLKSKGLTGVLQTLRDSGFTARDAIAAFEVRAAAAFNAMSRNASDIDKLQESFYRNSAALKANEIQMKSLANQLDRFRSIAGTLVERGLAPFLQAFNSLLTGLNDFFSASSQAAAVLQNLTIAFAGLGVALAAVKLGSLVSGLTASYAASMAMSMGIKTLSISVLGLQVALGPILQLLTLMAVGIGAVRFAMSDWKTRMEQIQSTLEKSRAQVEEARGAQEKYAEQIKAVEARIEDLTRKSQYLSENQSALNGEIKRAAGDFAGMGIKVEGVVSNVDDLLGSLKQLRNELSQAYIIRIQMTQGALGVQLANLRTLEAANNSQFRGSRAFGVVKGTADGVDPNQFAGSGLEDLQTSRAAAFNQQNRAELFSRLTERGVQEVETRLEAVIDKLLAGQSLSLEDRGYIEKQVIPALDPLSADNSPLGSFLRDIAGELRVSLDNAVRLNDEIYNTNRALTEARESERIVTRREEVLPRYGLDNIADLSGNIGSRFNTQLRAEAEASGRRATDTNFQREFFDVFFQQQMAAVEATEARLEQLKKDLATEGFEGAEQVYGEVERQLAEARGNLEALAKTVVENNLSIANALTDRSLRSARRSVEADLKTAKNSEDPEFIRGLLDGIEERVDEMRQLEKDKLLEGLTPTQLENLPELVKLQLEEIDEQYNEVIRGYVEQIDKEAERAQAAIEQAGRTRSKAESERVFNDFVASVERRINAGDAALVEARRGPSELRDAKTQKEMMDSDRFGGRYSDVQRRSMDESIEALEKENLKQILAVLTQVLEEYEAVRQEVEGQLALRQAKLDALLGRRDGLTGSSTAEGQQEFKNLSNDISSLQREIKSLEDKRLEVNTKITKEATAQARIMAELGQNLPRQITFWEGLSAIFDQLNKDFDLTAATIDGVKDVVDGLQGSFSNLFGDLVNGTKSASEAFRDFALSVIKSVQDMIVKMLVMYAIQQLIGWIAPGAVGGPAGMSSVSLSTARIMRSQRGGEVPRRFATGGAPMPNRDSVYALLEPGEFVMRKSAVDAIGLDTLSAMNAMGNRRVSNGPGALTMGGGVRERDTVNVYVVPPEQKPVPGPKDIIAVVSDDMMRGGTTKKLVKQIVTGA